jgi:hypothetical protein
MASLLCTTIYLVLFSILVKYTSGKTRNPFARIQSFPSPAEMPENVSLREVLKKFRQFSLNNTAEIPLSSCGVIMTFSTNTLSPVWTAEASHIIFGTERRTLTSLHETLMVAAKLKSAIRSGNIPIVCNGTRPLLVLFTMSFIFSRSGGSIYTGLKREALCTFDSIVYLDKNPWFSEVWAQVLPVNVRELKIHKNTKLPIEQYGTILLSLLGTPFLHTLYLENDIVPCRNFQVAAFDSLISKDMLITAHPYGMGPITWGGAPVVEYPDIVNGGVLAYSLSNERSLSVLVRSLELLHMYNASVLFDMDQLFMQQSLFEGVSLHGLTVMQPSLNEYCRHYWDCGISNCRTGCALMHQKPCNNLYIEPGLLHKGQVICTSDELDSFSSLWNKLQRLCRTATEVTLSNISAADAANPS